MSGADRYYREEEDVITEQGVDLTFDRFSRTNMRRHLDWPKSGPPSSKEWSLSDWAVAAAEEMGEVCGAIKRINRIVRGDVINGKPNDIKTVEEARLKAKKEIGDTLTYLDLLAQELDSNLGECASLAFNGVSEREGLPHRV
jgi:NTP pyrophosphatase (non-canonical NTP hydrolase)